LERIKEAFDADRNLENLLLAPYFTAAIQEAQAAWRSVIGTAVERGIPIPAFTTALSYYDSIRCERLPANLLQAQRDYFGAHTYERTDKPGTFHSDWLRLRKTLIIPK
jgi:6-phosphogluconate dehydrogenase